MILKDLLDKYTDEEIANRVVELYSESPEGYLVALKEIRGLTPIPDKDGRKWTIMLEAGHDIDSNYFTSVYGTNGQTWRDADLDHHSDELCHYALGFTSWANWLDMDIPEWTLKLEYSGLDVLAHVLYEMTWHGYSNEAVQSEGKIVLDSWEDYKQHPEDAMTMEQLLDEMEKGE